jgi:hypothetical protein
MNETKRTQGFLFAGASLCFAVVAVMRFVRSDGSGDTRFLAMLSGIAAVLFAVSAYRAFRNAR